MRVTRWRSLARWGGLPGLLVAGVYVAARLAWSAKVVRWTLLAVLACVAAAVWLAGRPGWRAQSAVELPPRAAAAPLYDLVDLGVQGEGVAATGVNARGDVSGVCILSERQWHAVVWRDGKMRDLGTLGGPRSLATCINDSGQVAGQSETTSREVLGFRWRPTGMEKLASLDGRASGGVAINPRGEIAGFSTAQGKAIVACLWRQGQPEPLKVPEGCPLSVATAVSDRGSAAGWALSRDRVRALAWEGRVPHDLGTLGGNSSIATATAGGLIGGASTVRGGTEDEWHACLWGGGRPRDLALLPGSEWAVVSGMSPAGEVVGSSGVG